MVYSSYFLNFSKPAFINSNEFGNQWETDARQHEKFKSILLGNNET